MANAERVNKITPSALDMPRQSTSGLSMAKARPSSGSILTRLLRRNGG